MQVITFHRDKLLPIEEWENTARDGLKEAHVASLAADYAEAGGFLQPPRCYFDRPRDLYIPVFGFHRFAAMLKLELQLIQAIVTATAPTKAQLREWQYLENAKRLEMSPMERARSVIEIRDANEENNVQVAKRLGINSPSLITDYEAWLLLPPEMQAALDDGSLAQSAGAYLGRCSDPAIRQELFGRRAVLSRDQLKAAVQKSNGGARKYAVKAKPDKLVLTHKLGVTIRIDGGDLAAIRAALGWAERKSKAVETIDQLQGDES